MINFLKLAAKVAKPNSNKDPRNFWLGCIGIRNDNVIVSSKNGPVFCTDSYVYQTIPDSHAEGRVLRKMDRGGTLYVARVHKNDGSLAIARPCIVCQIRIKAKGIKKVYYSINDFQYGIWNVKDDFDIVKNCKAF